MICNIIVETFIEGGWVMWPILATFFLAVCVVLDRVVWWLRLKSRLDLQKQALARESLSTGDFA